MPDFEIKNGVCHIPEGTKKIDSYAFEDCTDLVEVIIPESVEVIGAYAFKGCTSLQNVILHESVRNIKYMSRVFSMTDSKPFTSLISKLVKDGYRVQLKEDTDSWGRWN